jgi:hypothetical protein
MASTSLLFGSKQFDYYFGFSSSKFIHWIPECWQVDERRRVNMEAVIYTHGTDASEGSLQPS